ncbi:GTP-binding protein [Ancylothrix sp. C2]|uniref:GTP-binding protein n=1 Tax=Ancylothrix sp. D3o TaxID=2953691 RepID=UPI0021BA6726|nr:GTP-binding protein [Ancylothrix sp. D3o]MCT7948702.1 GTP-binding protein [Ancylothrix sp. D3o]
MNNTGDFDSAIDSVAEIQAELNYKQAKDALRELVTKLDLSAAEKVGLETEIQGLETTLEKLNRQQVQIAVFGMVGRGKSSLLNALLGQQIFETGPIHGVTTTAQAGQWSVNNNPQSPVTYRLSQIELIDTPGIDEVDGETREILAREVAGKADLIIFVVAGDMTKVEYQALSQLREAGKPMILVFNKIDQYPEADRLAIYQKIRDERVREILSPDEIVMAAASPLVAQMVRRPDGSRGVQLTRSNPEIDELKLKILEILDREGKSLVALNSMLFAGEVNERIINRKLTLREETANKIIWNCVITKAVAIALNPITAADLFSGAIIDVAMILTLSKLYGMEMTRTGALNLLQRIALSMGGLTVTDLVTTLGLSSLKSLLGIATPATGGLALGPYLSVAVTQAGVAGVSTYAIGQVTKAYLANGASWGPDGPKAVVSRILSTLDETSIMGRIKDELWQKLRM